MLEQARKQLSQLESEKQQCTRRIEKELNRITILDAQIGTLMSLIASESLASLGRGAIPNNHQIPNQTQ